MTATILRSDAGRLPLADRSVDLIVTSPPYWALRSYTDAGEHYAGQIGAEPTPAAYIDSLIECTREWMRVLKPGGSIWVNLGDVYARPGGGVDRKARNLPGAGKGTTDRQFVSAAGWTGPPAKSLMMLPERYRIACVDRLGLIARAVVIWSKPNGLPESVTDRVRRSHEDWVHLVKQPRYFAAMDSVREQYSDDPERVKWRQRTKNRTSGHASGVNNSVKREHADGGTEPAYENPLGKLPGSVWEIATQPLKVPAELGIDHFAAFPMEWPRRIISGWSPLGGTVLDPFGGTGTTALVADALGRRGISVDMSADYCRLAHWRTTDPGQRAAALQVEKPAVQSKDQGDLLSLFVLEGGV